MAYVVDSSDMYGNAKTPVPTTPNASDTVNNTNNNITSPNATIPKATDTLQLENEANAAYTEANGNQQPAQPAIDSKTSYLDANGAAHEGILRNGRTLDANGNEINGEFYVASPNGTYWKRNADGSSTQISAADYNAVIAGGLSENAASQQNNAQNVDAEGRFWTNITDADGTVHRGYILNGKSFYEDGTPIRGGASVVDSQGRVWRKDADTSPYGIDYNELKQDYTAPEAPGIVYSEDVNQIVSDEELAKMAMHGYQAANVERAESLYQRPEMPETRASDYEGQDFTEQINNVYEKKFDTVKTQIENQVKLGELDIDQALEKLPQIYDASANDISSQFEISKRNYNEYAAANGLSSGAKAQALLAMNNVYNANVAALRQKQADATADYENQRARLKLEAQGKITEALMQNETEKAQAILDEYNRQEQQNFELFLQGLEQDYKYYALEVDTALKEEQLREEQFQYDTSYNQKERMAAEESRQYALSLLTDLRKLEESARTADNATKVQLYNIENAIREFQANYGINIAQLQQNAMIAREEADLARDKFAEAQYEFAQGHELDLQKAQHDWETAERNADRADKELEEGVRQFDETSKIKWADVLETIRHNTVNENQNQQEIDITRNRYGSKGGTNDPGNGVTSSDYIADAANGFNNQNIDGNTGAYLLGQLAGDLKDQELNIANTYASNGIGVSPNEAITAYAQNKVSSFAKDHMNEIVTNELLDYAEKHPEDFSMGHNQSYTQEHLEELIAETIVWNLLQSYGV